MVDLVSFYLSEWYFSTFSTDLVVREPLNEKIKIINISIRDCPERKKKKNTKTISDLDLS